MNLVVITPVGPGHESIAARAYRTTRAAANNAKQHLPRPFQSVTHDFIQDMHGELGRSRARNIGIDRNRNAEWFFFLDADDTMCPRTLCMNDFESDATFGAVSLDGKVLLENVWPCDWHEVATRGAHGTLSMGFFCRASVARQQRFNEELDAGEDFDFYMRLPSFTKRKEPLVDIDRKVPSASGPRGYQLIDWVGICNRVIYGYVKQRPSKYDLRGDAILGKARRSAIQPRQVPRILSRFENRGHHR